MAEFNYNYPDFSELFASELMSDVLVAIKEERSFADGSQDTSVPEPQEKRRRTSRKRQQQLQLEQQQQMYTVNAHKLVLYAFSEYFKSKITNWSDSAPPGSGSSSSSSTSGSKPIIELLVPAGQQAVGEAFIKCMYEARPDLTLYSQVQLLQLLQLADSYRSNKVINLVSLRFREIQVANQISWDTIRAVLELPAACFGFDCFQPLYSAVRNKLYEEFGDLDYLWGAACSLHKQSVSNHGLFPSAAASWAIAERAAASAGAATIQAAACRECVNMRRQFLQLPFAALELLLVAEGSTALRVASEDTVVHSVTLWLQNNPGTSKEQLLRLASLLRLPHCSLTYLTDVICSCSSTSSTSTSVGAGGGDGGGGGISSDWIWREQLIGHGLLVKLVAVVTERQLVGMTPDGLVARVQQLGDAAPVAWQLPQRCQSGVAVVQLLWKLPLQHLMRSFYRGCTRLVQGAHYHDRGSSRVACCVSQGRRLKLQLVLEYAEMLEEDEFGGDMWAGANTVFPVPSPAAAASAGAAADAGVGGAGTSTSNEVLLWGIGGDEDEDDSEEMQEERPAAAARTAAPGWGPGMLGLSGLSLELRPHVGVMAECCLTAMQVQQHEQQQQADLLPRPMNRQQQEQQEHQCEGQRVESLALPLLSLAEGPFLHTFTDVEQVLRHKKLVQPDGCLWLRATIKGFQ